MWGCGHFVGNPADLNRHLLDRLGEVGEVDPPVDVGLIVPVFGLLADFVELLDVLFVEGVGFELFVLGEVQLGEVGDVVVLEEVGQVVEVVGHAYLLDLINLAG